jgi:hemerythrin-like domain-containing protein
VNPGTRALNFGNRLSPAGLARNPNPLDFIHDTHLQEREVCAMLDRMAVSACAPADHAMRAVEFLSDELPAHIADEEEDLFPLLRRRCDPDDEIDRVLARLQGGHRDAALNAPRIVAHLLAVSNAAMPDDEARAELARFAADARRHLILENAIILPFARLRLTAADLAVVRAGMLRRRGLDTGSGTPS